MSTAAQPFQFATAAYLTRVENQRATTVAELLECLKNASDGAIFYHTFQSLGRHHFLTEGFSNDFAQWALAALNLPALAEQLATLDIRSYLVLTDLRNDLLRITHEYCRSHSAEAERVAFEPFHFCECMEVTIPVAWEAWTLEEFRHWLEHLSTSSFHYHFLSSRLRLGLRTNDFSQWFENELELPDLAKNTNQIDVYTNTIEVARVQLYKIVDRELAA